MSHEYLTISDRNKIEVLKTEGYFSRRLVKILCFHHSTISREPNRCEELYQAIEADTYYQYKSSFKGRKAKVNHSITQSILDKLNAKSSPKRIASTILYGKICFRTIYNWIYSGFFILI